MNIQWTRRTGAATNSERAGPITDLGAEAVSLRLALLQNVSALTESLRDAWPDRAVSRDLELLNILYVPDRSFRAVGRFAGSGQDDLILCLHFLPGEESEQVFLDALVAGVSAEGVAHLPEWGLVATAFPEDPDLPELAAMLDLERVGQVLGVPPEECVHGAWSLLSYQPGKRCALRYRFRDRTYVGKVQAVKQDAVNAFQRQEALWSHPERRFRMPRPVACDAGMGARFETFLVASPLDLALDDACLSTLVTALVSELVKLHQLEFQDLVSLGPDTVLRRIKRRILPRLRVVLPELAAQGERIAAGLEQRAAWVLDATRVSLHGDFHLANFLLDDQGPVFIDLDELALGDPYYDLALFGSRLLLRSLHRDDRLDETMAVVAGLPLMYVEAGGRTIQPRTFAWYMAALLLGRQVKSCIRDDAPDKSRLVAHLLRWAEKSLADGRFPSQSES